MPSMARGLTIDGRDHLREAGVAGLLHGEVDQRELELGADAGEEVEAAAGDLGAAVEVDRAEHPAELDVVARLEVELRGRADGLEQHEVVLARRAGASSAARLGMLISAACHSASAAAWAASAALTSAASALVRASSSAFSSPCAFGISLPSCFCSARLASKSPIAAGGRRPRRAPGPRRRRRARAWPGRHARGRVRLGALAGRSWGKAIRRRAESSPEIRGVAARRRPRHTGRAAADRRDPCARPTSPRHPGLGPALLRPVRSASPCWSPTTGVR